MKGIFRIIGVLLLLYIFLLGVKLMGVALKGFGKGFAEQLISTCSDPFVGLFIGILSTSIIQSSSTTTAIVVGMVGGGVLSVATAIPIIMGANIGTTVTNTLVSFSLVTRKEDFRRAFAGAVVHDFFNLLAVTVLFPLEIATHVLERSALFLTRVFAGAGGAKFTSPLKLVLDPVINPLEHFFWQVLPFPRPVSGTVMLLLAFALIIVSLVFLVKTMRWLLAQRMELSVNKYLFRNDLTAFLLGISFTAVVQSSSVTTSLIVPLVGAGIVTLYRAYPYTLGANVGTTVTALLASLATVKVSGPGGFYAAGVTVALAHLLFNIFGMAIFYPLRHLPIFLARKMGDLAAEKKRHIIIFVLGFFYILPLVIVILGRLIKC